MAARYDALKPAAVRRLVASGTQLRAFPRDAMAASYRASQELSFPSYYEACVRPLLRNPEGHWPRCCAGGCEPCAQTLIRVAQRTLEILGTPRVTPIPEW